MLLNGEEICSCNLGYVLAEDSTTCHGQSICPHDYWMNQHFYVLTQMLTSVRRVCAINFATILMVDSNVTVFLALHYHRMEDLV